MSAETAGGTTNVTTAEASDGTKRLGFGRDALGRATFSKRRLDELLGEADVSTPAYFYDLSAIRAELETMHRAFGGARHLIAYAVKANSSGSILRVVKETGTGVDAVSAGELLLARRVGIEPRKIVLSGVAKRNDEIDVALAEDIQAIQVESVGEIERVAERARLAAKRARVSIRVNPSVQIDSHAHIATGHDAAKFGVARRDWDAAFEQLAARSDDVGLVGISTHVGSLLRSPEAYVASAEVVCDVATRARASGHALEYVDFGGGFGIDYGNAPAAPPAAFVEAAVALLGKRGLTDLMLVVEPGRSVVGSFGVLVASVVQHKTSGPRSWVMIDAGMNDLLRPALYGARHRIEPLDATPGATEHQIVGPVCESTDDFGVFPLGDVPSRVVIRDAGAYSFSMASEYNARPLPAEVFVDDGRVVHVSPSPGVEAWIERRARA